MIEHINTKYKYGEYPKPDVCKQIVRSLKENLITDIEQAIKDIK